MWGFAWMFWMVPLFFCFAMMRRWISALLSGTRSSHTSS